MGMDAVAQTIEKDSTYGLLHTFLYGINAAPLTKIADEKQGKLLIDGIPATILRKARNPKDIPWRDHGVQIVAECTGEFLDPTASPGSEKGSIGGHHLAGARVVINSAAFKIKNKALLCPGHEPVISPLSQFVFLLQRSSWLSGQYHVISQPLRQFRDVRHNGGGPNARLTS